MFVNEDATAALALQFGNYLHGLITSGGFDEVEKGWSAFVDEKSRQGCVPLSEEGPPASEADEEEPYSDAEGDIA